MSKPLYVCLLLLTAVFVCFADEIAVISTVGNSTALVREDKSYKLTIGDFVKSRDELRTGGESWLGCKFIDGAAAVRLFSNSLISALGQQDSLGLQKKLTIKEGSMLVKASPRMGSCTVLTNIGTVKADSAVFLVKITVQGDTRIVLLEGKAELFLQGYQAGEMILEGNTAVVDKYQQKTLRTTFESDFSPEEYAFLDPQPAPEPQGMTIPMVGQDGKIKYLELNW